VLLIPKDIYIYIYIYIYISLRDFIVSNCSNVMCLIRYNHLRLFVKDGALQYGIRAVCSGTLRLDPIKLKIKE
jgi:hypothetical protein